MIKALKDLQELFDFMERTGSRPSDVAESSKEEHAERVHQSVRR